MAFNYMNTGPPGRYPYHMPMHWMQQMDLSSMHVPPSTDLSNLMNNTNVHCNPVNQQIPPPSVELNNTGGSSRTVIGDLSSIHRPASELCIPSISSAETLSVHGVRGQYNQPFQHFPDQPLTLPPESCKLDHSKSKAADVARILCDSEHQQENPMKIPPDIPTSPSKSRKRKKDVKSDDKKAKRVRFVKPGCSNSCQKRCKQKISQTTREELFNEYWSFENDSERKYFIAQHAVKMPVMASKDGSRRNFSVDWAFTVKGESFSVCKLFFLDTLDVSEEMAYSAIKATSFSGDDVHVAQRKKTPKKKPAWFETDLDNYTVRRSRDHSKSRSRYEPKKEKVTEMKPGCTDACRRNCQSKFTHEERLAIFNTYRNLSNVRKQREYILAHMKRVERKCVRSKKTTRRGCSFRWLLPLKGEKIPVCKTFFLHTVGTTEHIAYNIGLQSDIQPAERYKTQKKDQGSSSWNSLKIKYLKALIAKGRLKPTFKIRSFRSKKSQELLLSESDGNKTSASKPEDSNESDMGKEISPGSDLNFEPLSESPVGIPVPHAGFSQLPSHTMSTYKQSIEDSQLSHQPMGAKCDPPTSFSQPHHPGFDSCSRGYFQQQSSYPHGAPTHLQSHQHDAMYAMANDPHACHDALLLQTLKNTTSDLFPFDAGKDAKFPYDAGKDAKFPFDAGKDAKAKKKKNKQPKEPGKITKAEERRLNRERKPFSKRVKEGCSETCRRKCNQKIPHAAREELFLEFWQLENDTSRREYILPIVSKVPKKSNKHAYSRRGCTIEWTVPYNGELHDVCKKFFLDTFDISENFVKTVHEKMERNDGSMEDMRGRHGKRSAVYMREEKEIDKFIKSLSTYKAVRCVKCDRDFPRWCLEKKLPLSKLYREYADERKREDMKPACRTSFTTICAKKFDLRNNPPDENICDQCFKASQASNSKGTAPTPKQ